MEVAECNTAAWSSAFSESMIQCKHQKHSDRSWNTVLMASILGKSKHEQCRFSFPQSEIRGAETLAGRENFCFFPISCYIKADLSCSVTAWCSARSLSLCCYKLLCGLSSVWLIKRRRSVWIWILLFPPSMQVYYSEARWTLLMCVSIIVHYSDTGRGFNRATHKSAAA